MKFYLRYTLAHLNGERQRSLFVIFCIAAGVAVIVSLRTLGLMIADTLAQDLQMVNKGDLAIRMPTSIEEDVKATLPDGSQVEIDTRLFEIRNNRTGLQAISLTRTGQTRLYSWADANQVELQPFWSSGGPYTGLQKAGDSTNTEYVVVMAVESGEGGSTPYPFYRQLEILEPQNVELQDVLSISRQILVSDRLARDTGLNIGDSVTLSGATGSFRIGGIVSSRSEGNLSDILSSIFPFVYIHYEQGIQLFHAGPTAFYARLPPASDPELLKADLVSNFPGLDVTTPADLGRNYQQFNDLFGRLVTLTGLVSLLIGGIGIAHTMLVSVTRRSLEISVLKTIGLTGEHISTIFLLEAGVLGLVGSIGGIGIGIPLTWILQRVSERFVGTTLHFALYPQAISLGIGLGLLATLAFSLLPILAAGRLRPLEVLRPEQTVLPSVSRLQTFLVQLSLGAILGLVVGLVVGGQDMGAILSGIPVAFGLLLILWLCGLLLRVLLWFCCRLPTFGQPMLRLAQRNLDSQRSRAANTLLALISGVFSLGLIWATVQGSVLLVNTSLEEYLGGNILATVQSVEAGRSLERKLRRLPGLNVVHDAIYRAEIVAINGNHDIPSLIDRARLKVAEENLIGNTDETIRRFLEEFDVKILVPGTWNYQVDLGQDFSTTPRENTDSQSLADLELLLEPDWDGANLFRWFELEPGDRLTLRFASGAQRTVLVRGINKPQNAGFIATGLVLLRGSDALMMPGTIPTGAQRLPSPYVLQVSPEQVRATLDILADTQGVYFVEIEQLATFTDRIAEQFAPLPVVIGGLALFAASTIIANSVTLATLERRRQIAIMKALGLSSGRVLGLSLLENGFLGLVGGTLGSLLSVAVITLSGALGPGIENLPMPVFVILILLAVAVSLGATTLAAWSAVLQKPLEVLRYE